MMINVKGTKSVSPEPQASQRYALKSGDEVSRIPLIIGGLLTGVAAYLSSIFSWGRQDAPQSRPREPGLDTVEIENPEGLAHAPPTTSQPPDWSDSESPDSPLPSAADSPRTMALRYPDDSEGAPLVADPTNGDADAGRTGRVDGGVGTQPVDRAGSAGHHAALGGNGFSGGESSPEGNLATRDNDSSGDGNASDGSSPSHDDLLEPGEDNNDSDVRPDNNRAPRVTGPVHLLDVAPCVALLIAVTDLLSKAEDPDGDALSVQNLSVSSGELTEVEGGWVFQSSGQPGPVTLSYQISDGKLAVDTVARFSVVQPPAIIGTATDDTLLGSLCADEIDGAGGNDNIDGRAGNDVINGGTGDDHIVAGDGDDVVFGGNGNDIIFGGAGNDHLFGGSGDDRLFGGGGDDVIFGNDGEDFLSGGDGDDLLLGGDGNDVIIDGAGRDRVFGGMGNDRIVAALDADDDVYDGGGGTDTLDYSHATERLMVDLVNGVVSGVEVGHDTIIGFEKVLGSQGADQFILGNESVALTGGTGNDVFTFANDDEDGANGSSHVIMDFGVGDRIRISEYEIFWKASDEDTSRFEQVYSSNDSKSLPIRYRHNSDDKSEWTIIESNLEDSEMWATTVTLQGIHNLSWSRDRDESNEWLS